jgi:hypothetical protein
MKRITIYLVSASAARMLVAIAIFVGGMGTFLLMHRRWEVPIWYTVVLPSLAVAVLWSLTIVPVVLIGVTVCYMGTTSGLDSSGNQKRLTTILVVGGIMLLLAFGTILASGTETTAIWWEILLGTILSVPVGYQLGRRDSERRWFEAGISFLGLTGLVGAGLLLLWSWRTPPDISRSILGVSLTDIAPNSILLSSDSNVLSSLEALTAFQEIFPFAVLSLVATAIGTLVFLYVLTSMVGHLLYTTQRGTERVEDLTFALITVASEKVRDTLMDAIEHNRELFEEYEFCVVIDEGADLQPELEAMDLDLIVVPDGYEPDAIAKGRAMQYFVETRVLEDEWYAFLDDDNLVQGREFLYEIPKQEAAGNLVMNPILVPRQGDAVLPFVIDHMRTLFDFTFFRTFTGWLGRPYAGLHGELLCARGDVLRNIGFDRPTIVEDFAFADELVKQEIGTWQSRTTTSILSPHSLDGYFTQRTRWLSGKLRWLPRCSPGTLLVTGLIICVWMLGIFGGWLVGGLWLVLGPVAQVVYLAPALVSSALYGAIYVIGVARAGRRHIPKVLLLPLYATIEHIAPYYALVKGDDSFEVIEK